VPVGDLIECDPLLKMYFGSLNLLKKRKHFRNTKRPGGPGPNQGSDLTSAVLVSCKDYNLKAPTPSQTEPQEVFPEGMPVFPITPLKTSFESQLQPMARTQFPLQFKLAWVVTAHKSQGLTLPRIRLGLRRRNEFSCDLTFERCTADAVSVRDTV
jgi:hypothetical protein